MGHRRLRLLKSCLILRLQCRFVGLGLDGYRLVGRHLLLDCRQLLLSGLESLIGLVRGKLCVFLGEVKGVLVQIRVGAIGVHFGQRLVGVHVLVSGYVNRPDVPGDVEVLVGL